MQIESFEASRADFDLYSMVEKKIYKIIKAWHNVAIGTDLLGSEYLSTAIPDSSYLSVQFAGPEMVMNKREKAELWQSRIDAGEATLVDMIMDMRGLSREEAIEVARENMQIERMLLGDDDASGQSEQSGNEEGEA